MKSTSIRVTASRFASSCARTLVLLSLSVLCALGGRHAASATTFSNEWAWDDGTTFYYTATYTGSFPNFNVFLDTDNNASTGYTVSGIGADFLIENTGLWQSTANGSTWSFSPIGSATESGTGTVQFSVPLSAIGSPASAQIAFQADTSGWVATNDPHIVSYVRTPTNLSAIAGNGQVSLSWTPNPAATSYRIYRGTSSGNESSHAIATGVTTAGYTDTSATNGTTYYYTVDAVDATGNSQTGNEASATPSSTLGAAYFVSTTGVDTNSGSISAPWATPQHAASTVGAGSTVYLESGSYKPFTVNVSGSATSGYTTFTNYPGEAATIDGTLFTGTGEAGLVQITNENYITISGLNIVNGSSSSGSFSPDGILVSGSDNHINIDNNTIHNIVTTDTDSYASAHGILVLGNSSSGDIDNITLNNNQVYSLQTGWSESVTLNGDVTSFTVENNTIHDNNNIGLDLAGGYGVSPLVDQARNGEVNNNTIYNCSTYSNPVYTHNYECAGLYFDGSTNITAERNTVNNNDFGVQVSAENSGKVSSYITVRDNVIYSNAITGLGIGGFGTGNGGTSNCTFVNNTIYGDDTLGQYNGEILVRFHTTGNLFENNIVYALSPQATFVRNEAPSDSDTIGTFDYNCYYCTAGAASSNWYWINEAYYSGFSAWTNITGYTEDAHSVFANPLFVSLTSPNFNLSTGSPALNSGNYLLGSTDYGSYDFASNARTIGSTIDMGAFEN